MKGSKRVLLQAGGLAVGVGLLLLLVVQVGALRLWSEIARGGPALLLVLPVSVAWSVCNTWAWRLALAACAPALALFRAHVVAEAVNNLTPLMALGGEPLKPVLLRRWVAADPVIASVINDNLVHALSAALFMGAGIFLGVAAFDLQPARLTRLMAATGLIGLIVLMLWLAGRNGGLAFLSRGIGRRLRKAHPNWAEGIARIDRDTRRFLAADTWHFWASLGLHLAGRLLGAVEAWLVMGLLGVPFPFAAAVFLISIAHVGVNLVFSFIPSQLGVQEAAAYMLFALIGLDPASALTLMLLRRARLLVWIGVGLALLAPIRRDPL